MILEGIQTIMSENILTTDKYISLIKQNRINFPFDTFPFSFTRFEKKLAVVQYMLP